MTNSILKPQNRLSIENRDQQNTLSVLVGFVNRSTIKMERRLIQLKQIESDHFDAIIRLEAEEHIKKQTKMTTIGYDLLSRISMSLEKSKTNEFICPELIQQYKDEQDILVHMDFEVTKKYFTFIHDYFQPQIIQLNSMAA